LTLDEVAEAERLLRKVASWSEDEIESLPRFYRETALQYRKLVNGGDTEPK